MPPPLSETDTLGLTADSVKADMISSNERMVTERGPGNLPAYSSQNHTQRNGSLWRRPAQQIPTPLSSGKQRKGWDRRTPLNSFLSPRGTPEGAVGTQAKWPPSKHLLNKDVYQVRSNKPIVAAPHSPGHLLHPPSITTPPFLNSTGHSKRHRLILRTYNFYTKVF